MSCKLGRWAAAAALTCALSGCSKREVRYQRVAVLPFENLSGDPALDWMSEGLSQALDLQMAGAPTVEPMAVAHPWETASERVTGVIQGYFSRRKGSLRVEAVLADRATNRVIRTASASGPEGQGILPLARSITQQFEGRAGPLGPSSEPALEAMVQALDSADPAGAQKSFEAAVAADPAFGAAYVAWAQWLAGRGDRAGAQQVLTAASKQGNRLPEITRDRLALLGASLRGERSAQYVALVALSRTTPADPDVFRGLAELDLQAHRYASAVSWYQKTVEREPDNPLLWNQLGYAQSYARDLEGATASLRRYQQLRPGEANPLDSLGDVHYYLGRFSEAEKFYLEAYSKAPSFLGGGDLQKAAWASLMRGDVPHANELFGKFLEARRAARDPLTEYRLAEWEFFTGRRKQAVARLKQFAEKQPAGGAASPAWSQLAVWSLEMGRADEAREYAGRAAVSADNPGARLLAELCRFVAQPAAPAAEWTSRAETVFPGPGAAAVRQFALGYALLWSRDFAAAAPLFRQLYDQASPSTSEPLNVLLAWTLAETKRTREIGDLLDSYPPPRPGGDQAFYCLAFPRVFQLRGTYLEQQGRKAEAQTSYQLYRQLEQ